MISVLTKCALIALTALAHELGHILTAKYFGIEVKKIGLNWKGLYLQRARGTGWAEIATCLSGPGMNLLLALIFWHTNFWFALCNLTFGWVNLLPIPHSDGSHALEAFRAMKSVREVTGMA